MKKTIAAFFVFASFAAGAFGQTTVDEWINKGTEYYYNGNYASAITAYSEAIKRDSSNINAHFFRGIAYTKIKNYDAAISDCNMVIKGASNFPYVYVVRGYSYGAKAMYQKAVADYKKSVEKDFAPDSFTFDKSDKADMWFFGAIYMEITVNRFLGNSAIVTKYDNLLKTVCDKNKVTCAEIETFYRNGIRTLISDTVDEEFNKISFMVEINHQTSYNCVLIRQANNQYVLSYESYFGTDTKSTKTLTATSLETLPSALSNSGHFPVAAINDVKAQTALIPAVAFSKAEIQTATNDINNFFLSPSKETFDNLVKRYKTIWAGGEKGNFASSSFYDVIYSLNVALANRMVR
jgi:tetratricopeptide (TPR) repeat protein